MISYGGKRRHITPCSFMILSAVYLRSEPSIIGSIISQSCLTVYFFPSSRTPFGSNHSNNSAFFQRFWFFPGFLRGTSSAWEYKRNAYSDPKLKRPKMKLKNWTYQPSMITGVVHNNDWVWGHLLACINQQLLKLFRIWKQAKMYNMICWEILQLGIWKRNFYIWATVCLIELRYVENVLAYFVDDFAFMFLCKIANKQLKMVQL